MVPAAGVGLPGSMRQRLDVKPATKQVRADALKEGDYVWTGDRVCEVYFCRVQSDATPIAYRVDLHFCVMPASVRKVVLFVLACNMFDVVVQPEESS